MLERLLDVLRRSPVAPPAAAQAELDAALEDWVLTNAVRERFDAGARVEIVERLWEVVYADGGLVRVEEALLRRVASALGVGDAEIESARAQAFARVGPPAHAAPGALEAE